MGKGLRAARHRFAARRIGRVGVDHAFGDQAVEHAVAGGARGPGVAVGPARLRRLRQGDEQRRLGGGQPLRLLAEIGERGGADALDVAAIGSKQQR